MLNKENMHNYQKRAVEHIINVPKCALWLEMGLGKTVSTLTAIEEMLYFDIAKVLIIAPLRVAHTVYGDEIKKWNHISDLKISKILGNETMRVEALNKKADIYVINRENVEWLVKKMGNKWDFDMIVIDESSSFKNPSSKRFKALKKVLGRVSRVVELTGTPSPNGYLDIWSQIFLLDNGETLGKTISMYKWRFFESDYMGYNYKLRPRAEETIQRIIEPFVLSMRVQDYLDLPDSISVVLSIPLAEKNQKQYKSFEKNFILSVGDKDVTAMTAATLSNKLLQFSSGFVYDENKKAIEIHTLKIEALKELIEENEGKNILLAYNYEFEKEMILKYINNVTVLSKDGKEVKMWNEGKIKILLAHPASAGHGLNLQYGGSIIVWYGFTWSLELYQQFNARLARQGQTDIVKIFHLAVGDIEKYLMTVVSAKEINQDKLLNSLKEVNERI